MEHQLEAWLKTYRGETALSPASWAELPKDCKLRLDNHARDEAVRRADDFARDGHLDLDRQDAIRTLVDSMAQCWMLPGEDVRRIVEDYLDELAPKPGFEFDKLSTRIFRRRVNGTWKDLLDSLDLKSEPKIIGVVINELDIDRRKNTDRTSFLAAWREAYDRWSLAEPKDAVNELLDLVDSDSNGATQVQLREILPLIKHRGGASWAKALELELEVGVETAVRDDLIRMLKRYSLIVKREDALTSAPRSKREDSLTKAVAEEPPHTAKAAESSVTVEEEVNDVEDNYDVEPQNEETEVSDSHSKTSTPSKSIFAKPTDEDQKAAEALFGEDAKIETEDSDESGEDETDVAHISETGVSESSDDVDEILEDESEASTATVPPPTPGESQETPDDTTSADDSNKATRLKDVFTPSPVRDKKDRFAELRAGELRTRVVKEMYGGDETLLDVFLAKLSGAPDWNRAKQFIANEFFRCKVDLHSELGEELFLKLKESLSD